jgi:hypothetical protein
VAIVARIDINADDQDDHDLLQHAVEARLDKLGDRLTA